MTRSALDTVRLTAGRPRLLINRRALLFNVRQIRTFAGEPMKVCAVVKADAYGHGARGVVDVLTNFFTPSLPAPAVDAVAVASLAEAAALPDLDVPILVLRPVECVYVGSNRSELEEAMRRGVVLSVISTAAVDDVSRLAERMRIRASVQVMLDTGMTREGCDAASFRKVIASVLARPSLRLTAIGTHLTDGEHEHESYSDEQLRMFHETVDPLLPYLPKTLVKHAANSGGTFFAEDDTLDMVRPGLALYGLDPTGAPSIDRPLRPVAKWTAPILHVRDVTPGTFAGYNHTWRATRATRIGLVPVGYADGYPRALSNRAVVRIPAPVMPEGLLARDAFCPVVGRVSMDYLTIDLANAPWAQPGDEVTLLDDDPVSRCSAYALAEQCGTIPYEILCNIGSRIVRVGVNPSDAEMTGE